MIEGSNMKKHLFPLQGRSLRKRLGNKAKNLKFLIRNRYNVPVTYVCPWDAYISYNSGNGNILKEIKKQLENVIDPQGFYAVRSSANIEDDASHSFAGQFLTVLKVRGLDNILEAIRSVWESTPGSGSYMEKKEIASNDVKMAVIIQEMVHPVISGVSFSKNPVTGQSEVIVEAVRGSGEKLLKTGITPERWANKWGVWIQGSKEDKEKLDLIGSVVDLTREIEKKYKRPVDLEWVFDGKDIHLVQVREIILQDVNVYSNKISREVLPGIIKPLVWSINIPVVNSAWVRILKKLTGIKDIEPGSLSRQFYYRAYFDMKVFGEIFDLFGFPRETLELLMGMEIEGPEKPGFRPGPRSLLAMPRIAWFLISLTGIERRFDRFVSKMDKKFRQVADRDIEGMKEHEILDSIKEISSISSQTAYYNIIIPLLAMVSGRILQRILRSMDIGLNGLELYEDKEQLKKYSPHMHLDRLRRIYKEDKEGRSFKKEFDEFIRNFGHFSDSGNDFSSVPWREDPDMVKKMIIDFKRDIDPGRGLKKFDDLDLKGIRRSFTRKVFNMTGRFAIDRERISSLYTFGYGQFRDYFLALGKLLAKRKKILEREDIFYLYMDEVYEAAGSCINKDLGSLIQKRKDDMERVRDIDIPDIIYGDNPLPADRDMSHNLQGIPTSHGIYTGPVKVLKGLQEMNKMTEGDILVIPYSDIGWTPLFGRAGAVISESGGILSHSSILAREYNIPAVLSVKDACRLPDNTLVTVDGFKGEVYIHDKPKA